MKPSAGVSSIPSVASSIPNITTLRGLLDYGDAHLARCNAFYDDVRIFRKRYRTQSGLPGISLHNWKSPQHQAALEQMTSDFLDKEGNGTRYWPDDNASPNRNKLRYSKDHILIKQLMTQLIFRINQQQHRNIKYKSKGQPRDGSYCEGESPASAINIDDSQESSPGNRLGANPNHRRTSPEPTTDQNPEGKDFSMVDQWLQDTANCAPNEPQSNRDGAPTRDSESRNIQRRPGDIYEVPLSPGSMRAPDAPRQGDVRERAKRGIESETTAGQATSPKRFKSSLKPPSKRRGRPPGTKKSLASSSKQTSHRKTTPTRRLQQTAVQTAGQTAERTDIDAWATEAIREARLRQVDKPQNERPEHQSGRLTSGLTSNPSETLHIPSVVDQPRRERHLGPSEAPSSLPTMAAQSSDVRVRVSAAGVSNVQPGSSYASSSVFKEPNMTQNPIDNGQPTLTTKPKVSFEIMFRVIVSRTPTYLCKGWQPKGKFQDKSLSELLTELPVQGTFEGLAFALEGPGMRYEEEIKVGDDNRFENMKKYFLKNIKACLGNAHDKKPLIFEVEIEPMREGNVQVENEIEDADIIF